MEGPRSRNNERFKAPNMSAAIAMDLYPSLCIVIKKIEWRSYKLAIYNSRMF